MSATECSDPAAPIIGCNVCTISGAANVAIPERVAGLFPKQRSGTEQLGRRRRPAALGVRRGGGVVAEAHGSEPMTVRRENAVRAVAAVVVAQGCELLGLPSESDRFLNAIALVITGGVAEMVLVWLDDGLDLSRDELVEVCVELLLTTANSATAIAARVDAYRTAPDA